jgi:hypothetical protein
MTKYVHTLTSYISHTLSYCIYTISGHHILIWTRQPWVRISQDGKTLNVFEQNTCTYVHELAFTYVCTYVCTWVCMYVHMYILKLFALCLSIVEKRRSSPGLPDFLARYVNQK